MSVLVKSIQTVCSAPDRVVNEMLIQYMWVIFCCLGNWESADL